MKLTFFNSKRNEDWHTWFAWHPVIESEEYGLIVFFLETTQRKWISSQCYGHTGNWVYKK